MKKLTTTLAAVAALSFALPAMADEAKAAEAAAPAAAPAAKPHKKLSKWMKRLKARAGKLFKKLGDAAEKAKAFYKENIVPKVRKGKGRLWRAKIRFFRNYLRAMKKGKLEKFLGKAKAWWDKRKAPAPKAPAPAATPAP